MNLVAFRARLPIVKMVAAGPTHGMKRTLADALSPSGLGARPAPPVEAAPPVSAPHLAPVDPCVVQVPADGLCLYHCAVAAADASSWVRSHSPATGLASSVAAQVEDTRRAELFRQAVIARVRVAGRAEDADRLGQAGPSGYPGEEEMAFVADELSGQVVLQCGEIQTVHGTGPLSAHFRWVLLPSGAGHFLLHQSWLPMTKKFKPADGEAEASVGRGARAWITLSGGLDWKLEALTSSKMSFICGVH